MTRLMKSRSGSTGNLNTTTSPRCTVPVGRMVRSTADSVGPKTNLLTSRWSPISRLFSIEPVGILKACTTKVRMNSARMTAVTIASKYSRSADFLNSRGAGTCPLFTVGSHLQHGEKRLLRDFDSAHPLHPLLAFLLLLEQLSFP